MARLSTRSAKSAQKSTIRYIASSDIERTARDYGVSESTLRRFIAAKPESLAKSRDKNYRKILSTDARAVAKENQVRLVPRLTREKIQSLSDEQRRDQRNVRAIRYTESVTERVRKVDKKTGKIRYRPANQERVQNARKQIVSGMAQWNTKTVVQAYKDGLLTEKEARTIMRNIYKNSGAGARAADAAFAKAIAGDD